MLSVILSAAKDLAAVAAVILLLTAPARAQYQPIPNYVGPGTGANFRADVNNRFSGTVPTSPALVKLPFAQLPATETDGQLYYCLDCQQLPVCSGGGSGAFAFGLNGQWSCAASAPPANFSSISGQAANSQLAGPLVSANNIGSGGDYALTASNPGGVGASTLTPGNVSQLHLGNTSVSSTPYSVASADSVLLVNAGTVAITVNLPAASATRRVLAVKKTDTSSNAVTIAPSGGNLIDGLASLTLGTPYQIVILQDTGTGVWSVLAERAKSLTISNATSTGTTLNELAKLTGAPSTAVMAATSDPLSALVGAVTGGAGTSGSAQIIANGAVLCVFDGATVAGDYFTASGTAGGQCHDAGASAPAAGWLGRVLTTNAAGGTYPVIYAPGAPTAPPSNQGYASTTISSNVSIGTSATTIKSLATTAPSSGGPWRVHLTGRVYLTTTPQIVDCWISDGTNVFASAQTQTGATFSGALILAGISPVTYANSATTTFTLFCIATSGQTAVAAPANSGPTNTGFELVYESD